MAQQVDRREKWTDGLSQWSSRLLVLLFAVGAVILVVDVVLMASFALQANGITWGQNPGQTPGTPTTLPSWTATATPTEAVHTPTPTARPTETVPPTALPSETPTATATPTQVVWPTATATPTETPTQAPTATATATPPPVIHEWKGEYWDNRFLDGAPVLVRNDEAVDLNWGTSSPHASIPADRFSARWTRRLWFERGTYRFHALVDDGVRLWVDGVLVIDAWTDHSATALSADYALVEGHHTVRIEYYERIGHARIHVWWEKLAKPEITDWKGEYWNNRTLDGNPLLVRNDEAIDFNWVGGSPAPGLSTDNLSARWTRMLYFTGRTVRFHALVDDGVRLWVDNTLVIDAWTDHSAREVTGDLAIVRGWHPVRVEYYEHSGDARIHLWWNELPLEFADWKGEYWPNGTLDGEPALVRNDAAIDFDWADHAPAVGLARDGFSARWTRTLHFERGVYRFFAWADDAVRVYVDGRLVVDEWHGSADEVYIAELTLEGSHTVVVHYADHSGAARVRVWWKRVGDIPTPTPTWMATATATQEPTATPTLEPTATPTTEPTATPTQEPTSTPTQEPTSTPTQEPTATPTEEPTATATTEPTMTATVEPTATATSTVTPTTETETE